MFSKESGGDSWEFYQNKIYPFKGELEKCYKANQTFTTELKVIFATICVVLLPKWDVMELFFPKVPKRKC